MKRRLPRYIQIADQLRRQIVNGQLQPDAQLPTQRELAQKFDTSIMTVRQALEILEEESLVRTEHGIGTFVVSPRLEEDDYHLMSFSNEMKSRNRQISTRLVDRQMNIIHPEAQRALDLNSTTEVHVLERVRLLGEKPFVFQRSFLPAQVEQVVKDYSDESSLYDLLRQITGQIVGMAKELYKPVVLDDFLAEHLKAAPGTAAFKSIRVSFNQDGIPLVYDEAIMLGDFFNVTTERIGRRNSYRVNLLAGVEEDALGMLLDLD
jgi:GntR family transcriptional regulator